MIFVVTDIQQLGQEQHDERLLRELEAADEMRQPQPDYVACSTVIWEMLSPGATEWMGKAISASRKPASDPSKHICGYQQWARLHHITLARFRFRGRWPWPIRWGR